MSDPTPQERREAVVAQVHQLCKEMNDAGAIPRWTPSRLHIFINLQFEIDDAEKHHPSGLDALGFESLATLIHMLQLELDALQAEKDAERSLSTNTAVHALERAATASERRLTR